MNKPFPRALIRHAALTPEELVQLWNLDEQEFSRPAYLGLCCLVEGVIAARAPGLHCQHGIDRSSSSTEGAALCRSLLHPENGFTAAEIEKGRAWLAHPGPPLTALLAFFFRLRHKIHQHQLAQAQQRAA
ncbi:MAG: hypothetical protein NVS3B25_19150 [Hymenobacter sp.]